MDKKNAIQTLRDYQQADVRKSFWIVTLTIGLTGLFIGISASLASLNLAYGFILFPLVFVGICRVFIIEHDSGHLALFKKPIHDKIAGNFAGLITMIPYGMWRYVHNIHHATVAHLDKRDVNPELWTMTVEEYKKAPIWKRLIYQLLRSVLVRVFLAPLLLFLIARIPNPKLNAHGNRSVLFYAMFYISLYSWIIINGYGMILLVSYIAPLFTFYVFALLVFYLQHQYEDTWWIGQGQWNFFDAATKGASYMESGKILQWITGNVGFHHIHHLNSKIPFYKLPAAYHKTVEEIPNRKVRLSEVFHHLQCKVWDPEQEKLVPIPK